MNLRVSAGRISLGGAVRRFVVGIVVAAGTVPAIAATVELADGTTSSGKIAKLTDTSLDLEADGVPRSIGIREVRVIAFLDAANAAPQSRRWPVRVALVDGSVFEGDDFAASEKDAAVVRDGRTMAIARELISEVDFRRSGADGVVADSPAWLTRLQEGVQERAAGSDVVVVGSAETPEFVECAIVGVAADAVTVVLDDETIRVKRSKVIGLKWLRNRDGGQAVEAAAPPSAVVEFDGGRVLARRVTIDREPVDGNAVGPDDGQAVSIGLAAGEPIRMPASALRRIDFAAGRTVSLVSLAPERVEIEPWFGLFKSLDGLAGHFDPKPIAFAGEGGPIAFAGEGGRKPREGLRLRPRTVMEWRLPEHARSIAMTLAESSSVVTVAIDGREAYRGQPSTAVPVEADVAGGRRLTVTVDFPPSGPGTGGAGPSDVVLVEPRIER